MDYMKGYFKRRKRRRASRNVNRPRKNLGESGFYRSESKYAGPGRRPVPWRTVAAGSAVFAVFAVVLLVLVVARPFSGGSEDSEAVAAQIAAVPTLAPGAIATPQPKPRSKAVALTFDDGPSTVNTPRVLEILKQYNAHATFFVLGDRVEAGAEVLKQEVAQGHEIGNHTWSHVKLSKLGMKEVNRQYDKTANLVKKLIGYDIRYLRPPWGEISQKMRDKLKHPMILWSVDTLDWKSKKPKAVLKEVKKSVKDGAIILMHDIHPTTAEALKLVLPWLVENDYDILTVSELADRKGVSLHNGKAYGWFTGN